MAIVSFLDAIRFGFRHYFDFRSRSTRAEYWWWFLFVVLADVILSAVDMMIGTYDVETNSGLISLLFAWGILVPGLALGARRLHDINRTGWWQLMWLSFFLMIALAILQLPWYISVPVILSPVIILLRLAIKPSDEGTNKHGPAPRHPTSQ